MSFTFVRPADIRVLEARPALDVGTGDGQTRRTLLPDSIGIDRSISLLRGQTRVVCADAAAAPFRTKTFRTVLCADLFHHLDDDALRFVIREIADVLDGTLVAWWYAGAPHAAPDAPKHPRSYEAVADIARAFFDVGPLELEIVLGGGPPTVGLLGRS